MAKKNALIDVVPLSDAAWQAIPWLWLPFFSLGKLHYLFGASGNGCTLLVIAFAASLTLGSPWPNGAKACEPGAVAYLSASDTPGDILLPRFKAAGADLSKVFALGKYLRTLDGADKTIDFTDTECVAMLESVLRGIPGIKMLIIDPISQFLGNIDANDLIAVRQALFPLQSLAERLSIAVVYLNHSNKTTGKSGANRSNGSTAFIDMARTAFMVDVEQNGIRVMKAVKSSYSSLPSDIHFSIVQDDVSQAAKIEWHNEVVTKKM